MERRSRNKNYDVDIKLITVGNSGVGKSCMLLRFVDDKFSPSFIATIGIDFKQKVITHDDKTVCVKLWDTAGQERFRNICEAYYKGSDGVIFVYDITDRDSFDDIVQWVKSADRIIDKKFIKLLVGNKIDLESKRLVDYSEGDLLAKKYNMHFYECSAKSGENIDKVFDKLCDIHIYDFFAPLNKTIKLKSEAENTSNCCR